MQFENKIKWHRSLLHLLEEEDTQNFDCISLTDGDNCIEQKIYLAKVGTEFEVRVYKANPQDTYVPSVLDFMVKRYEANDEFASFFFEKFFFSLRFICLLKDAHPEYSVRPI